MTPPENARKSFVLPPEKEASAERKERKKESFGSTTA